MAVKEYYILRSFAVEEEGKKVVYRKGETKPLKGATLKFALKNKCTEEIYE